MKILFLTLSLGLSPLIAKTCTEATAQNVAPKSKRFSVRHIDPQGVGYTQGYTSFDLFAVIGDPSHSWIPFVDLRAHIFDHGQPAANAGLGFRFFTPSWVFGVNGYYDYRKTKHEHYSEAGLGFEALHSLFDLRLNGYLPFGKKQSPLFGTRFSHFEGHHAILRSKYEFAFPGGDFEVGGHLRRADNGTIYLAGGGYYFASHSRHAGGVQARASATFYDILQLQVNGSWDPVFHWIGQGQVGLNFSFGPTCSPCPPKCRKTPILWEKGYQDVERHEIIVLDQSHKDEVAINPETLSPYVFWFTNNLSSSSGTIESPYPSLITAANASQENDILYVFPGNGSAYNTESGITLKDQQKLWGSSVSQFLATTKGNMVIPPQSSTMPTLTGDSSATLVVLGNHNEVSGMHFFGDGSQTVALQGDAIDSVSIRNNLFDGSFDLPIETGVCDILGQGTLSLYNNAFSLDSFGSALRVSPSGNALCTISSNTFDLSASLSTGIECPVEDGGTSQISITNNVLHISGDDSRGIYVQIPDSGSYAFICNNNSITSSNDLDSSLILLENSCAATPFPSLLLSNNILQSENPTVGIGVFSVTDDTTLSASISQNQVTNSTGGEGIHIRIGDDNASWAVECTGNRVICADGAANIKASVTGDNNQLCLSLTSNTCRTTDLATGEIALVNSGTDNLFYLLPSTGNTPETFTTAGTIIPIESCPE